MLYANVRCMDAPTCTICKAKHWPREAHIFKEVKVAVKQRWSKDKYNAYMRGYMKRYRAKKLGGVNG